VDTDTSCLAVHYSHTDCFNSSGIGTKVKIASWGKSSRFGKDTDAQPFLHNSHRLPTLSTQDEQR
jgi:hypothetical protein